VDRIAIAVRRIVSLVTRLLISSFDEPSAIAPSADPSSRA